MLLTIDTETTGLPKNKHGSIADADNYPRLVGLSFIVSEDDGSGADEYTFLVRPDGFDIPPEATAIHGITTAMATKYGYGLHTLLLMLNEASYKCSTILAHGLAFDYNVLLAEYYRVATVNPQISNLVRVCTMEESKDYCQLPGKYGYKWAKLTELHQCLFGCSFEGNHESMQDARMALKCYLALVDKKVIPSD